MLRFFSLQDLVRFRQSSIRIHEITQNNAISRRKANSTETIRRHPLVYIFRKQYTSKYDASKCDKLLQRQDSESK